MFFRWIGRQGAIKCVYLASRIEMVNCPFKTEFVIRSNRVDNAFSLILRAACMGIADPFPPITGTTHPYQSGTAVGWFPVALEENFPNFVAADYLSFHLLLMKVLFDL